MRGSALTHWICEICGLGHCGFCRTDDLREAARIKASASYQRAIDVSLTHQLLYIIRLNTSTVLDADSICGRAVGNGYKDRSDKGVRIFGLGGGCCSPC